MTTYAIDRSTDLVLEALAITITTTIICGSVGYLLLTYRHSAEATNSLVLRQKLASAAFAAGLSMAAWYGIFFRWEDWLWALARLERIWDQRATLFVQMLRRRLGD